MKEEIEQIEKNKTWTLVPRRVDKNVIGTKWVFRNKLDENADITRNKARLVCKGYAQEEGLDYGRSKDSTCKNGRSKDCTCICSL